MEVQYNGYSKQSLYLNEIKYNIEFAKSAYLKFCDLLLLDVLDTSEIFSTAHYFLIHISNIDKIMSCEEDSTRGKILFDGKSFKKRNFKEIRRLRNHLEYFDERLDTWISNYDGQPYFDMNIVTGAKGYPDKAFLRAIDGKNYKFYGETHNLEKCFDEICELEKTIC